MQGILAPPRGRAMQTLRLTLVTAALRLGNLELDIAVEVPRLELLPVAGRDRVLEPQIEPDRFLLGD